MKSEEEIDRYIRLMAEKSKRPFFGAYCHAAIEAAEWVLGKAPDPPGYAELLAQDKEDDKRMDRP